MPRLLALAVLLAACGPSPQPRTPRSGPANHFLTIEHRHDMSPTFQLVGLAYTLNGEAVYARRSDAEPIAAPVCVLHRLVQRGTHEIGVDILYRGHGEGVFSYLSGYQFRATATHDVDVPGDAFGVRVVATGHEGGGATAPLEDRPEVRWTVEAERADPTASGCRP
jgi:hypothetical protein